MLAAPRAVWVMVPSGDPTRATVDQLMTLLEPGDTIIEGGNSNYREAQSAAPACAEKGIAYIDAGVSGGVWGLKVGYCLMVGGDPDAVVRIEPIFRALAPEDGFAHVGPPGAGHFTKMIHNGIEYGMLQAYAEGFALLEAAEEFDLDLAQIVGAVESRLGRAVVVARTGRAGLGRTESSPRIKGYVEDSGEGRWTVQEAIDRSVAAPVITAALFARFSSRQPDSFAAKIVAALRNQFGGHKFFEESAGAEAAAAAAGGSEDTAGPEAAATGTADDR